uniref:DUF7769 domain-containing protein n=1 Tax=Arundo donax TaxID=35708 RepID=A0A0A9GMZ7_ARUDO
MDEYLEVLQDYGVYSEDVDIVFDEEELPDSDDDVDDHENEEDNVDDHENEEASHSCKNLTNTQRQEIYEALLATSNRGILNKDCTTILAEQYNVSIRTVQRVWNRSKECRSNGVPVEVSSRKASNYGRKKIQVDLSQVASIPLNNRSTLKRLAKELGVSKSSLHRWFKQGLLRRHSNSFKPCLKEENSM